MKNSTIVYFRTGRGGRFNNPGYKCFEGSADRTLTLHQFISDGSYILWYPEERFENAHNWLQSEIEDKYEGNLKLSLDFEEKLKDEVNEDSFAKTIELLGIDVDDFIEQLGVQVWCDENGKEIITDEEVEEGVGALRIDGDYDTREWKYLEDCNEQEVAMIVNSDEWDTKQLTVELIELGLYEPEETEEEETEE